MEDTSVILITYNRPKHTKSVLEALRLHGVKNLFIYSDGPKTVEHLPLVQQTRHLFDSINWTTPRIIIREENYGLARSIVTAVDEVFERYDRLILLEDDCVPQVYFFDFVNNCLARYEQDEKVFGISGYTVPIPDELLRDYPYDLYFSPRIGSWGWATWRRAWRKKEDDILALVQELNQRGISLDIGGRDVPQMVADLLSGQLKDVWTISWLLSVYKRRGYYVYPTKSHIDNIGNDGTGVHCGASNKYAAELAATRPLRYPNQVVDAPQLYWNFRSYFD